MTAVPGGALAGLRVFDLSIVTAGAASTQVLADFGAEVIKIESPERPDLFRTWTGAAATAYDDLHSSPFRTANRNKRGFAVDLKHPEGLRVAHRLVAHCDVVVENFRQGVLDRLGLGFDRLVELRSDIVLVSVSSQGTTGPNRSYGSFGSTVDGLGGAMSVTGYDEDSPMWSSNKVNFPDQAASLLAPGLVVLGVLAARESGRPRWIDLSQREVVTAMLAEQVLRTSLDGVDPVPAGNGGAKGLEWLTPCAGDDEWLAVSVADFRTRLALAEVLGRPDLSTAADDDIVEALAAWSRTRPKVEGMQLLQAGGVPAAAVMKGYELHDDPYFRQIGYFQRVPDRHGGAELQRGFVVRAARQGGEVRRPAPHVGEHTVEILAELGYREGEIEALLAQRVVVDGRPTPSATGPG